MIDFRRIRELIRKEERLRWALERAMAKATKITATISDAPKGGGSGKRMEDDAIAIAMLRDRHKVVADELRTRQQELARELKRIKDPNMYLAMDLRYMRGKKINEICETMGYSDRSVFRFLGTAEHLVIQRQKSRMTV